jgi:small-conductance mechanosensitive channel
VAPDSLTLLFIALTFLFINWMTTDLKRTSIGSGHVRIGSCYQIVGIFLFLTIPVYLIIAAVKTKDLA